MHYGHSSFLIVSLRIWSNYLYVEQLRLAKEIRCMLQDENIVLLYTHSNATYKFYVCFILLGMI